MEAVFKNLEKAFEEEMFLRNQSLCIAVVNSVTIKA